MRSIGMVMGALVLCGCAQPPLYQWGGYEDLLYRSYKSADATELKSGLEAHVHKLQEAGHRVPPGLYSEIATLHLQMGDKAAAVRYYTLEKEAWPESRGLMEAPIRNLDGVVVRKESP